MLQVYQKVKNHGGSYFRALSTPLWTSDVVLHVLLDVLNLRNRFMTQLNSPTQGNGSMRTFVCYQAAQVYETAHAVQRDNQQCEQDRGHEQPQATTLYSPPTLLLPSCGAGRDILWLCQSHEARFCALQKLISLVATFYSNATRFSGSQQVISLNLEWLLLTAGRPGLAFCLIAVFNFLFWMTLWCLTTAVNRGPGAVGEQYETASSIPDHAEQGEQAPLMAGLDTAEQESLDNGKLRPRRRSRRKSSNASSSEADIEEGERDYLEMRPSHSSDEEDEDESDGFEAAYGPEAGEKVQTIFPGASGGSTVMAKANGKARFCRKVSLHIIRGQATAAKLLDSAIFPNQIARITAVLAATA